MSPTTAAYGTWPSPLSVDELVADALELDDPSYDGRDAYWVETRPRESGRACLVRRRPDTPPEDVLGADFSVRTRVHEYGGLAYDVRDGVVVFANADDQRLYRVDSTGPPRPLTDAPPAPGSWRYAEPTFTPDARALVCVRERHEHGVVVNDLVLVDARGDAPVRVLAEGHDFYAAPAVTPDGHRVAFLAWDHPQMPWDGTVLYEGRLEDHELNAVRAVCGGPRESVLQPRYGHDGALHYASDRSGWWNLYRDTDRGGLALAPREAEFALAPWILGQSTYAPRADGSLLVTWHVGSRAHLGVLAHDGRLEELATDFTWIKALRASDDRALLLGGSPSAPLALVERAIADGSTTTLRVSHSRTLDPADVAMPEEVTFATEGGRRAHAYYYAPTNRGVAAPDDERPPLLVRSHGGPTASFPAIFNPAVQFWTSRGIGYLDVDYGGTTGYGRAYRERLRSQWGVVDVDDCVNAARHLVAAGRADPTRLLIHGRSAGGYTALCALTFRDTFAAGASYFAIADLRTIARDTHKFEAHYLDGLVGPWPASEELYLARSPLAHADRLHTPTIVFQGLEDTVVPPSQSSDIVAALAAKGVLHAYVTFEGEGHGFRRAPTKVRAALAELAFYGRVLGFTPADADAAAAVDIRGAV